VPLVTGDEIRETFLRFFEERDHLRRPSASLVPAPDDTSTLLTIAGMQPLKPYFMGREAPPAQLLTTCQRCFRTPDIEEVGNTRRHLTFFEMLGNFSVGEYFKEGAIDYALELSLDGFGLDRDRIWVTVFGGDDELGLGPDSDAIELWRAKGVPDERIVLLSRSENFWQAGPTGPCGPCSELYLDRGPEYGPDDQRPGDDTDRFLEYWNLVFMELDLSEDGSLTELPSQNIDTGLGLERMAVILQDVDSIYETDLFHPLVELAEELSGRSYDAGPRETRAMRIIADHSRGMVNLLADGVVPSNEDRGYVLRRIMRRATRAMRLMGAHEPTMRALAEASIEAMGPQYPELYADVTRILTVAGAEEASFLETLSKGVTLFDASVPEARAAGNTLSGERAFALHDTYGFPIDLTLEMAEEQGLTVDEAGFRRLMDEQRQRAKQAHKARGLAHTDVAAYRALLDSVGGTTFTGYAEVDTEATVRGLLGDDGAVESVRQGDEVEVVLDRTPFYAEAGGQLGDSGWLEVPYAEVEVLDTQRPLPDLVVHRVRVKAGELTLGSHVGAHVDVERRRAISRAHTATHLIHRAFRAALGDQATQAGSLNAPGRLRFDFASPTAVPQSVLADVEDTVNAVLIDDLEVRAFVTTQAEARRIGAMALFGEKYGEAVRVVEVGDYARELCGGTHAARSGQLGLVKLMGEASIGAGVRRVEALVGLDAFRFLAKEHVLVSQLAEQFKAQPEEIPDRIAALTSRLRDAEKELERLKAGAVLAAAGGLAERATDVNGVAVVAHEAPPGTSVDDARKLALDVRGRLEPARPAVVVIAVRNDGKANIVVTAGPSAQQRGLKSGELIRDLAAVLGGGGGGKDELATAGGSRADGVPEAIALVPKLVANAL
jgi:alanyl-tRNA synthetase